MRNRFEPILPVLVTGFPHYLLKLVGRSFVLSVDRMIAYKPELEGFAAKPILLLLERGELPGPPATFERVRPLLL